MTRMLWLATLLGWLGLCSAAPDAAPQEITWDDLMPADYQPDKLFGDADLSTLEDGDPRAAELMQKLQDLWKNAPVVKSLDGTDVRLPGFAIPLESDTKTAKSFILVPYYGACIHVPPPPSNQIVLVRAPQGAPIKEAFDMVWVTGRLHVEAQQTDVAHAGYALDASLVEPYVEE
jgi:uncharacterized protein